MSEKLTEIVKLVEQSDRLSDEEKSVIIKSLNDADKALAVSAFKIERLEKVKHTTTVLLEQTIEELETKRRSVEEQKRELEIEAALERVRSIAMGMRKPADMLDICRTIATELNELGINEIRNVQTAIFYEEKGTYMNYEFYVKHDKSLITEVDYRLHPTQYEFAFKMLQGPDEFFTLSLKGQKLNDWYEYQKTTPQFADTFLESASSLNYYWYSMGAVALGLSTYAPLSEEQIVLFRRFRNVFELSHRRYLDIERAEAQARESQIQLALERVRARTMGMHNSSELGEVAVLLFEQVKTLGIETYASGFNIWDEEHNNVVSWMSNPTGSINPPFEMPIQSYEQHRRIFDAWKKNDAFLEDDIKGEDLAKHYQFLRSFPLLNEAFNKSEAAGIKTPDRQVHNIAMFSRGYLLFITQEPQARFHETFIRFAKVFEQTYTRFLDLKKAEAQAREAKVETALERIRSRSMAMQKSDELKDLIRLVNEQLVQLNIFVQHAGFIVDYKEEDDMNIWLADPHEVPFQVTIPYFDCAHWNSFIEAKNTGKDFFTNLLSFEEKNRFYEDLFRLIPGVSDEAKAYYSSCAGLAISTALLDNVGLYIENFSGIPYTTEENNILMRFGKVFQQAYTRFLDLQKAEMQTRESQIQLALERVRARTMAMQHSDELADVAYILFQQFKQLGEDPIQITIGIFNEEQNLVEFRITGADGSGSKIDQVFNASIDEPTLINKIFAGWKGDKKSTVIGLKGKELLQWIEYRNKISGKHAYETKVQAAYVSVGFFSKGVLSISTVEPLPEETIHILERFATVFDLTYTRFLDLKQAEESARESQIEAALERVRGKAMAMHNSNDLSVTASMVFTELRKLGITPIRCGVGLLNEESRKAQLYSATSSAEGDGLSLVGWVLLEGHPVLEKIYDSWLKREDYYPELGGEQLRTYYELLLAGLSVKVPDWKDGQKQHGHFFSFSIGCLYAWSVNPYNESEIRILKRFASIIDLTFRRYIELQKSEVNAREAVKQAALDRVRAEIASMRTVADLEKITPLIWNELTILGIPFIRCGVFIMDDAEQRIHTFLSTPDGEAIAAFHIPYNTPGNIGRVLTHWKKPETFVDHWDEREFNEFAETLVKQRALSSTEQYLQTIPHGGFHLHFLPFLQGMLYVGNSTRLNEDQLRLIQSLAGAFSTAYARYEDFNKLEIAKQQVDSALNELRATQTQLVHAEKMASLGELTAGIAHEIQNPLNFVNNFSEVSSELLEEIKSELDRGDVNEAKVIVEDVKQNLQKIAHHGKRADGIVKSMLQHSRKGSGQKDLVDINLLVDEYLRMSYHGFRAKDKSFNAILETHYDPEVKTVSIVGQDIGRVLLNLFNNAFYAVNERRKEVQNGFEPTIQVTTSRLNGVIEIRVKDNGTGIPGNVLEKIYQPFFTTKPTGEGTGLGLSLSYDIITKGHGGYMKVETAEGKGSEFFIQLPNLSSL